MDFPLLVGAWGGCPPTSRDELPLALLLGCAFEINIHEPHRVADIRSEFPPLFHAGLAFGLNLHIPHRWAGLDARNEFQLSLAGEGEL